MTDNTSPDPTAETQKQQCIFCHIISGKISSRKIYEDDKCIAVLDINPANPGHALILPKEHYTIMPMMPEEEIAHLFRIAKKISTAQIRSLNADGTNIFMANGAAAGQKAPHFMIHVIPRKENDGITCFNLPKNKISNEDQEKLRQAIKTKVDEHMGVVEEEPLAADKPKPEHVETGVEDAAEEEQALEQPEEAEFSQQETQPTKEQEARQEEEQEMMNIPPPEHYEKTQEEEEKPKKKKFDIDSISKLFG
ncbi:MAG: HIT domain-containing protein [Nanoarchaeota archaeon]|nr:HIT domain-containing protein [Nanoarchaeota archaeon]